MQQSDIKYSLDNNPINTIIFYVVAIILFSTIIIGGSLFCATYLKYLDHFSDSKNIFFEIIQINRWVFQSLSFNDIFNFWEIYLAGFLGVTLALYFNFYILRGAFRTVQMRQKREGKNSQKIQKIENSKKGVFAGDYNRQELWTEHQDRGLVIGPPRTGKTTFMLNQILRSMNERQNFIAVDIKPEISDILRADLIANNYNVIEFDPINGGDRYNPLDDIADDAGIFEFVASLIPSAAKEPAWADAERAFFRLALQYLKYGNDLLCSLPNAYDLIADHDTAADFLELCATSEHRNTANAAKKLNAALADSKPVQAGFNSVFEKLNYLSIDATRYALSASDFSIRTIGRQKRPAAVFLKFEETCLETMGGLLSALYGHTLRMLIKTHDKRRTVALYLDEIGNIPPISGLLQKLNTIASRKMPLWLYFQSIAQMETYGSNARDVFFGSADLQMFFRSNDQTTRKTVEELAGTITTKKQSQTVSGCNTSNSIAAEEKNRINAFDVGQLAMSEVITFYKSNIYRGVATPHYIKFKKYRK